MNDCSPKHTQLCNVLHCTVCYTIALLHCTVCYTLLQCAKNIFELLKFHEYTSSVSQIIAFLDIPDLQIIMLAELSLRPFQIVLAYRPNTYYHWHICLYIVHLQCSSSITVVISHLIKINNHVYSNTLKRRFDNI